MLRRCLQVPAVQITLILLWVILLVWVAPKAYGDQLAVDAMQILKSHCYSCHGAKHNGDPQFDVTDYDFLTTNPKGFIVPGDADRSKVLRRITKGEMPPPDTSAGPLSPTEVKTLQLWVNSGAKGPQVTYEARKAITERWVRDVVRNDQTRRTYRYFSFANLYNAGLTDDQLANARAAFSKAINMLQLTRFVVIPKQVDSKGLVFRVDQGDLDWDNAQVQKLFDAYPYHEARYYFRADWFIAKALQPPLYHDLLDLPRTDNELEKALGIDTRRNFLDGRSLRVGVENSRVSNANRIAERSSTANGSYWRTFDFRNQTEKRNAIQNPLGPAFEANTFNSTAFAHDGGEIIFTLPNGFPGFFVVDARGNRLDKAPEDVVSDPTKISRSAAVVPGLSCITCHTETMQTKMQDSVRSGFPFGGSELEQVANLYRSQREVDLTLNHDRDQYVQAIDKALTPFIKSRIEPVREVVERYNRPLTLEDAAYEVSVDPYLLKKAILTNSDLQRKGLRPLADGRTISRQTWEQPGFDFTPAQSVTQVLSLYQE